MHTKDQWVTPVHVQVKLFYSSGLCVHHQCKICSLNRVFVSLSQEEYMNHGYSWNASLFLLIVLLYVRMNERFLLLPQMCFTHFRWQECVVNRDRLWNGFSDLCFSLTGGFLLCEGAEISQSNWWEMDHILIYSEVFSIWQIEKGPVQTVAIKLEAHNSLEYN